MENLTTLINEVDDLISKESWKYSNPEMDRLLVLSNSIFDLYIHLQEDNDVNKLKHDNVRGALFIQLKAELSDGKKVHTDTSAKCFLDGKFENEDIVFLTNKYMFKTCESKLKLLMEKLNLVKKHFTPNQT